MARAFGLIEGYPDGNFGLDRNVTGLEGVLMMNRLMNCLAGIEAGNVTRAEICTMMVRVLDLIK